MIQVLYLPNFLPTSINKSVGRHWAVKARQKKGDREIIEWCWHHEQAMPSAKKPRKVSIRMVLPKGQRSFDRDNIFKGLLDALKHAGAIVDDSPKWCKIGDVEYVRHDGSLRETFVILEDLE